MRDVLDFLEGIKVSVGFDDISVELGVSGVRVRGHWYDINGGGEIVVTREMLKWSNHTIDKVLTERFLAMREGLDAKK